VTIIAVKIKADKIISDADGKPWAPASRPRAACRLPEVETPPDCAILGNVQYQGSPRDFMIIWMMIYLVI